MLALIIAATLSQGAASAAGPLRPPNGTYVYAMRDKAGSTIFTSTILVKGSGPTFDVSETTKLPNGAVATTTSTWSSATLLPSKFEVHQGKVVLRARISATAVRFDRIRVSFSRINGTAYILPSVGLIANSMMLPYAVKAHPGQSITLAEIQNNQTVLIQPHSGQQTTPAPPGDIAIFVTKDKEHGNSADQEQIVTWLNPKTGVMDGGEATPDQAKITLLSFTPP